MDMAIDRSLKQLILDSRIDLQHLRVVFQHLVEIIFSVELAHSRHAQGSPDHQLFRGRGISSKITHRKISLRSISVQSLMFKAQSSGSDLLQGNGEGTLNFEP